MEPLAVQSLPVDLKVGQAAFAHADGIQSDVTWSSALSIQVTTEDRLRVTKKACVPLLLEPLKAPPTAPAAAPEAEESSVAVATEVLFPQDVKERPVATPIPNTQLKATIFLIIPPLCPIFDINRLLEFGCSARIKLAETLTGRSTPSSCFI